MFCQLKSRYRNAQLHLPFDIEVVMHAHLLHPRLYAQCCDELFGETVGLLQEAELTPKYEQLQATQTLWHQAYGTDLLSPDTDIGFVCVCFIAALTSASQRGIQGGDGLSLERNREKHRRVHQEASQGTRYVCQIRPCRDR